MLAPVVKRATVLYRAAGLTPEEFLARYASLEGLSAGSADAPARVAIHRLLPSEVRRGDAAPVVRPPRCDGLTFEWWASSEAGLARPRTYPPDLVSRTETYLLDEVVQWDHLATPPPGAPSPGVEMIVFVRRRPDLSFETFRERYLQHAIVAREHHPGIARYVQNFVVGRGEGDGHGDDAGVDAVVELHFATERDRTERFYRDASSPAVVAEDVARFMERRGSWSILAVETVVRRGP